MATDFFDRQDQARKQTFWLVVYLVLAVLAIIATVYAAFTAILVGSSGKKPGPMVDFFDPIRLAGVALATGTVIALGSLYKILSLREGGAAVARSLGGRLVDGTTREPAERRLLNIVEEMALASGVPVPPVYLMDSEPGINAFAAGSTPGDAVIGVTRGSIDHLDRDQLQGVIAHEFSHILNGDMRLDLRLMGTLHGILLLALIGQILMRFAGNVNYESSSRDNDRKDNNGAMAFFLFGVALYAIGFIGVFFGRLIKAAVSRQREFLADASAVQFTRNPSGIAGALKKIGGLSLGSSVQSPSAEEASHMFFGDAVPSLSSLLSTHPPLEERVKRLDPNFDGTFPPVDPNEHVELAETSARRKPGRPEKGIGGLGSVLPGVNLPGDLGGAILFPAMDPVKTVGAPKPEHLAYATNLVSALPDPIVEAAREPYGAACLIYALLLGDTPEVRQRQLGYLAANAAPGQAQEAERLGRVILALGPEVRVPIVDLALPALRTLSPDQYFRFRSNIPELVKADNIVSLFEFALHRMLFRHLDRQFDRKPPVPTRFTSLGPLTDRASVVLGALAWIGQDEPNAIARAYAKGWDRIGPGYAAPLPARDACDLPAVNRSLDELAAAAPAAKKPFLEGCAATIAADGRITVDEGELLRAIADSLDCPMPPLIVAS